MKRYAKIPDLSITYDSSDVTIIRQQFVPFSEGWALLLIRTMILIVGLKLTNDALKTLFTNDFQSPW
jgi:hypothetical protein